jgi:biotin carboxylase
MARIMFLGGGSMQIPPITYAKQQGHFVVTADYLPSNPGHRLADEYVNVSVTDREAVLRKATELKIDGIVAYASDIAAPTAAYVAEQLKLPGKPYEAVRILTNKGLFRRFLAEHGFNYPRGKAFRDPAAAESYLKELRFPVFVKPVDSAGSKGVTRIEDSSAFRAAYDHALGFSLTHEVIVEETIVRSGYQVAGDGFAVDGELCFRCFANEHFDKLVNGLVPIGESFPAVHDPKLLDVAHRETQRLIDLLEIRSGAFNFDFVFTAEGEFYFLELGPRNGGNLIPDVTRYATGVDLIKYTVDDALGLPVPRLELVPCNGYWASYIVHATTAGRLKDVIIGDFLERRIVERDIAARPGDRVQPFIGSNHGLGTMIVRFDNEDQMLHAMDNMEEFLTLRVE